MATRQTTRWTADEETLFASLVEKYDRDFKRIQHAFASRTYNQIRSHYYNGVYKQQYITQVKDTSVVQKNQNQESRDSMTEDNSFEVSSFALFTLFD
ncbi:SANT/Myb_domain [Hexamita inflata]|uniref:SANT/Myb domain n=1 Tax=Hexamita inflata TaxID=28002 RepID=A0AA86PU94_9EUKA|nr:SANT/Myb domain [Hexamita inflata]CAI9954479.1 SANT/Myb domain [Hexamita inflata]